MYTETTHDDAHEDHDHHGPASGLMRWVTTTNHKDIGTLYLWLSFIMFLYGGSMAMIIRLELFQPGLQFLEPHFFNQMTTMHGLVMVFGAIMPAFVGLANWLIPMMIGAPDMALPRLNNWSFWILPFAFTMLASTTFMESGAPAFGWTFYAPLSTTFAPASTDFFIFAVHLLGISSVMGAINIIATILNMRAPGQLLLAKTETLRFIEVRCSLTRRYRRHRLTQGRFFATTAYPVNGFINLPRVNDHLLHQRLEAPWQTGIGISQEAYLDRPRGIDQAGIYLRCLNTSGLAI